MQGKTDSDQIKGFRLQARIRSIPPKKPDAGTMLFFCLPKHLLGQIHSDAGNSRPPQPTGQRPGTTTQINAPPHPSLMGQRNDPLLHMFQKQKFNVLKMET